MADYHHITKSPTKTINTLPEFNKYNNLTSRIIYGKDKGMDLIRMSIEIEYIVLNGQTYSIDEKIGSLYTTSVYTLLSTHNKEDTLNILHKCVLNEIEGFIKILTTGELSQYPIDVIKTPSFDELLPTLKELFYPDLNLQ